MPRRFSGRSRHSSRSCFAIGDRELSGIGIFEFWCLRGRTPLRLRELSARFLISQGATLNQSSSQMNADSHLSAHHVTIVTDAGGLAFIKPAEAKKFLRVDSRN